MSLFKILVNHHLVDLIAIVEQLKIMLFVHAYKVILVRHQIVGQNA